MAQRIAVVTGASSGIGEAIARKLSGEGWTLFLGARRIDRLKKLADEIGAQAYPLDVTDANSVKTFCAHIPAALHLLVNNAGGALGLEPIAEARDEDWLAMYQSNVLGLMRMTRELLPKILAGAGHIVNVTSVAGRETYAKGGGYTAAKHAARAITQTLRLELNGTPVRITDLAPGLTETEFSNVRFFGDKERAAKVYQGLTPLTGDDIADCLSFVVNLPAHVNIDELVVKPVAQANANLVARDKGL